jgi:acyl transferase domain-containing protein/acyl carrier protein
MNNWDTLTNNSSADIAVIGLNGRFPGAKNINEFWQNLRDGVESISFFRVQELETLDIAPHVLNDHNFVKAKGVLEDVDLFDASFFALSPKEAEMMDPQHRLFLECAWEALESAGYNPETYEGSIGVYAGTSMNSYGLLNLYSNCDFIESVGSFQAMISSDKDYLTTRVSYKLNLKGPSYTVQTACSTSLVAVHIACQCLLSGECDIALAGGVSISIPQKSGELYHEGGVASPDGHCRAFDAKAQGTVSGSGVGIVILKRLVDALSEGDYIHAVIKGSAINNDGSLKVGYTAPSLDGQAEVIAEALAVGRVEPETVTYIEAHGTGTPLGDPIEIAALTKAFRASTQKKGFCAIGSVKSNIGHLNAAAGVAGLIKTILALKHKLLPPSLHFEQPNPKIDFANSPFYVNGKLSRWETNGAPLRAGVSSFGIGGTNVHVVLEEPPIVKAFGKSRLYHLLVLSAKTHSALDNATTNLAEHLKQNPDLNLADVAYTLQVGRRAFSHRRMLVCHNHEDAVSALATLDPKRVFTTTQESKVQPIVFMFPGQGAQYVNMASELYQVEPTFCRHVDHCSEFLKPHLGVDLRDILYPEEEQAEEATQQLNQTFITQSALFVIEYALAKLWIEWGVHPQAMIGHSIGEYVAACLSGVFSLEDALTLVAVRGRLMQELPNGAMLAISLLEKEVYPFLGKELSLAAVNGPSLCVVSGSIDAVNQLAHQLAEKGVAYRRLHTSHAFHSEMIEAILLPFTEQFKKITLKPPKIPYVSNVTGTWITAAEATEPSYWVKHMRQTVRFTEGVSELLKEPNRILLEVGPGQALSTLVRQHLNTDKVSEQVVLSSLHHLRHRHSDLAFLLNTLGQIWLAGTQVNFSELYAHESRYRVPLPTYPFERQRYWIEQISSRRKKPKIADWFYIPVWKRSIAPIPFDQKELAEKKLCWLVFVDNGGFGSQIVQRLKRKGQDVVTVILGEQFIKHSEQVYTIAFQQRNAYKALLKELHASGKTPERIVHLCSLTQSQRTQSRTKLFEETQNLGFYSLLFLTQALGVQNITNSLKIIVVSNNVQEVIGEEVLCPEKATLLGPVKVIPQEYPNITCRSIDVVIPNSPNQMENKFIDQLLAEITEDSSDQIVAYRGKHRWVQTFEPVRLDRIDQVTPLLKQRGVYLITGGLGGIGLVLAEHLAKTVQAKLILTGRSAFPTPDKWEKWLANSDEQDSINRKIQKLQELEKLGAELLVVSADVANPQQMQETITQAEKRFGQLNGVIHAAGIVGEKSFNAIAEIGKTECELQFQPKVYGTLVLEEVLYKKDLDFCLLMSSLSSVLGGLGFAPYSAANLFMDAFVQKHKQKNSIPWISVNWDGWQLGEESQQNTSFGTTVSELVITPKEGVKAFQRILSLSKVNQVVVSTGDLQARIDQWVKLESLASKAVTEKIDSSSRHSRPDLQNTYVAPRNEIEQTLANIWQELLGIEQVGIQDNFLELGGHSLLATQVISRVREAFQIDLPIRNLLEEPTVATLAETIVKTKAEQEDNEEMQIIKMLENFSEDEVEAELTKRIRINE